MAHEDDILDAPEEEKRPDEEDNLHIGLQVLSFCIPLAGAPSSTSRPTASAIPTGPSRPAPPPSGA
ncbi:MAG: hypothetical protein J5I98_06235 [Phaeodactylibacter sp.]|nr:hypothetical protein [Phaeodactylibacter sp.]